MSDDTKRRAYELAASIADSSPEEIYGSGDPVVVGPAWSPPSAGDAQQVAETDEELPWNQAGQSPSAAPRLASGTTAARTVDRPVADRRSVDDSWRGRVAHPAGGGRRLTNALLVAIVVLLAGGLALVAARLHAPTVVQPGGTPRSVSIPTQPSPSSTPSASTPATINGARDCSAALGGGTWCPTTPRCWQSVFSYQDSPYEAIAQLCTRSHVYQTFALTPVSRSITTQSRLDAEPNVRAVCSREVLQRLLPTADASWEVYAIPGTNAGAGSQVAVCIVGKGEQSGPLPFDFPR